VSDSPNNTDPGKGAPQTGKNHKEPGAPSLTAQLREEDGAAEERHAPEGKAGQPTSLQTGLASVVPKVTDLIRLLLNITDRYPFLNAVWFVVVVVIALKIARLLGVHDRATFVAVILFISLFVLVAIYKVVTGIAKAKLALQAQVLIWAAITLFLGVCLLLAGSVFFGWPLRLQRWLDDQVSESHWEKFKPNPPDSRVSVLYYKNTKIRRDDGFSLEYRVVEDLNSEREPMPWSVFVKFPPGENTIQAHLKVPDPV
jgi:hypothetical protein